MAHALSDEEAGRQILGIFIRNKVQASGTLRRIHFFDIRDGDFQRVAIHHSHPRWPQRIALENAALRQQLTIFKREQPRPRLRHRDRLFWIALMKIWKQWRTALVVYNPLLL